MVVDDRFGAGGEFGGDLVLVVAAVADPVAEHVFGHLTVSLGCEDGDEVELGGLFGWGDLGGQFCCSVGSIEIAFGEACGGDQVGDVDDGALEDLVESARVGEPGSAVAAELPERRPGDEGECAFEVVESFGAAGFAPDAEPAEQVGVHEDPFDLVGAAAADAGGVGLAAVGEVGSSGARVGAEPGAQAAGVFADAVDRQAQGVASPRV